MNLGFSTHLLKESVVFFSILVFIAGKSLLRLTKAYQFEYETLLLSSLIALLSLATTSDLLTLYLAIELQSFAIYSLVAIHSSSEFSLEASVKYFILGAISSCFLLLGIAILYFNCGSLQYAHITLLSLSQECLDFSIVGILLITVSLLFKLGVAPFHYWVVDVYEGSLTSLTAFFSSIPKIVFIFVIAKLLYAVFAAYSNQLEDPLWFAGLLSIFVSSIAAIYQRRVKRLFAYSSIGQLGFISLALSSFNLFSVKAVILYIVIYSLITINSFSIIILARTAKLFPKYLLNWVMLLRFHWSFALLVSLSIFALAGIPPLSGFLMKLSAMISLIIQKNVISLMIVVIFSCFSAFYYIRIIKVLMFSKSYKQSLWLLPESQSVSFCCYVMISTVSLLLLYTTPHDLFSTLTSLDVV
jgi:NADH-quinone oxidoreductase subunit N